MIELIAQAVPPLTGVLGAVEAAFPPLGPLEMTAQHWAVDSMPALIGIEFGVTAFIQLKNNGRIEHFFAAVGGVVLMAVFGLYLTANQIGYDQYAIAEIQVIANSFVAPGNAVPPAQATPDAIYAIGDGLADHIANLATSKNWLTNTAMSPYVFWAGWWVQMGFLALALEALAGNLIVPFAIGIASMFLGCVVCRFARPLSKVYLQVIIGGLVFAVVVHAMVGVGIGTAAGLTKQADAIDHNNMRVTLDAIAASGSTFFFFVCAVPTIVGVLGGFSAGRGIAIAGTVLGSIMGPASTIGKYFGGGYGSKSKNPFGGGGKKRDPIASLRRAT